MSARYALVLALLRDADPSVARLQDIEVATRLGSTVANMAREIQAGPLAGSNAAPRNHTREEQS